MRFFSNYVILPMILLGVLTFQWERNPTVSICFGLLLAGLALIVAHYLLDRDPVRWGERYLDQGRYAEARREFAHGLKNGNVAAGMALGCTHLRGAGGPRDNAEATRIFSRTVDRIELFLTGTLVYSRTSIFASLFSGDTLSVADGNNSEQVNMRRLRDILRLLENEGDPTDDETRDLVVRIKILLSSREDAERMG